MDEAQHKDTYPWTWEPAAGIALGLVVIGILALQLGRSAALLLTGAGPWWPPADQLATSSWAILQGNTTDGLQTTTASEAPPELTLILAAAIAVVLVAAGGWAIWQLTAQRRHRGMATPAETRQLLGVVRLRRNRRIIRPDLYRKAHL